ncbi:MAG: hypothetical protein B7Y88_04900 [Sphingomonadales bacterium 32-64-17]|nr:MAG: hypothetical protein B7Y88_04900 [Sphingomonadales bacterium 32-64-17]
MAEVSIKSRKDLRSWLDDKPAEWAHVLAVRTALRLLPLVSDPELFYDEQPNADLTLQAFRAMVVSSGAAKIPPDVTVTLAARAAARAAPATQAASVPSAAARSAARAAHAAAVPAAAAAAAEAAIDDAADAAVGYDSWHSFSIDCVALQDGVQPQKLLARPLWLEQPDWFTQSWRRAEEWLELDYAFFWRNWYLARLKGSRHALPWFDADTDRRFHQFLFEQDDDWWRRNPVEVNRQIADWVNTEPLGGSEEQEYYPDGQRNETTPRDILENTADPQAVEEGGKLGIKQNAEFGVAITQTKAQIAQRLIDLAFALSSGLEANAPSGLPAALARYATVLERNIAEPATDTLNPLAGIVRNLRREDGHEAWARGLAETFDQFLTDHNRLFGEAESQQDKASEREKLTLEESLRDQSLANDVEKFTALVRSLAEAGVTNETAQKYLDILVKMGMEIAYGGPQYLDRDQEIVGVPKGWSITDSYRANVAGLSMQIQNVAFALSVTGHPQFQSVIPVVTDFVTHMARYWL